MAIHIEPNGDRTTELETFGGGATHAARVEDGIEQPAAADTDDGVSTGEGPTAPMTDSYTMSTYTMGGMAVDVTIWIYYHGGLIGDDELDVSLWNATETVQYGATQNHTCGVGFNWHNYVFAGVNLSQAQLDGLVVRIVGTGGG